MSTESRTRKALRNSVVTIVCQIVYLIASFVCRTVFTKILGAEYLGISGLFANVLTILSFAELGIGTTLIYRLYAPLANGDNEKVKQYVHLYKNIYRCIICVILALGVSLIPFLDYLVEAPNVRENVTILYLLYLGQTLVTYVFVYKKSVLIADQKDYVVSLFTQAINIVMNVAQCVMLVVTRDFVTYCVISIVCGLLNNIISSIYVDKKYPFIKDPVAGKLSKDETSGLLKDAKGLLLTKIASTAFGGTDNIFISVYIGIKYVGILSNYTLLLVTVNTLMNKIFGSITATIGNLAVGKDKQRTENVLERMFFLNTAIYGYCCIGMLVLLKEFVTRIWLSDEFILSDIVIALALVELFFRGVHYPIYTVRNAMGFFSQYRFVFVLAALLNILLDFILVKPMGLAGLFVATIFCRGITYVVDIFVVYHKGFQSSVMAYFSMYFKWLVFLVACYLCSINAVKLIACQGIPGFILKAVVISFVYLAIFFIAYRKAENFHYYIDLFKKIKRRKI